MTVSVLERIVITFNPDGSFKGAHASWKHTASIGDQSVSKISTEPLSTIAEVQKLLPDRNELLIQLQEAKEEILELMQEIETNGQ